MAKAGAPGAPRHEVALPRCAILFPVASLSAADGQRACGGDRHRCHQGCRHHRCSLGSQPNYLYYRWKFRSCCSCLLHSSCFRRGRGPVCPAPVVATSSRTAAAAAFAGDECLLGLSGRSLCPLLLRQVGVTSADHADDLVTISVFHRLQRFFDEIILVGQRANETCGQHCIMDPPIPFSCI